MSGELSQTRNSLSQLRWNLYHRESCHYTRQEGPLTSVAPRKKSFRVLRASFSPHQQAEHGPCLYLLGARGPGPEHLISGPHFLNRTILMSS